jgi:hypothetical protein
MCAHIGDKEHVIACTGRLCLVFRAWRACGRGHRGEEMDVREVVVPCERREERSEAVVAVDWTEVRAEGGCERGQGAFEGGIAIAAVAATGGGGGGRRHVFWREREELLVEEVGVTVYVGAQGSYENGFEASLLLQSRSQVFTQDARRVYQCCHGPP